VVVASEEYAGGREKILHQEYAEILCLADVKVPAAQ
jgi:hypothetical protein